MIRKLNLINQDSIKNNIKNHINYHFDLKILKIDLKNSIKFVL